VSDDESVSAESTQDRGGVPGGNPQEPGSRVDRKGRVLAQECVDPSSEVSQSLASEEIVELVGQLVLDHAYQLGP
jgi:hypothetical protein